MTKLRNRIQKLVWKKIWVYIILYVLTGFLVTAGFLFPGADRTDFPVLRSVIIVFASVLLTKYFVYMILSPWHEVVAAAKYRTLRSGYEPLVSVIIPAWNEEVGLLTTVKSLLASTYRNLEIVVVNDGSTDNSDHMMTEFTQSWKRSRHRTDPKLIYHYQENGGKGKALNTAIKLSSGDLIISIDADCLVEPEAVYNFVKVFQDARVMAAVGNVKIGNTNTILGTIQYLEFLFSFYFKRADSLMNTIYIIGGAAGAFRREVFEKLGYYNTTNITEDIELSVRIQDAGMKIVYAHDAIIHTEGATTLNGLMKQRLRWKRGRFETFAQFKHLFFSFRKKHNKVLTCAIMPLALFGEVQLFAELGFLGFLYMYSYLTNDYSSFLSGILVVGSMFLVQMLFDDKATRKVSFILLAPIGWLLFYVSTLVEYQALVRSIWSLIRGQEIKWQRWQRSGVYDTLPAEVK
ncbi:MAG: glycosyltransferase family 2 protein [Candidatus Doudnabacteria bacterium]|nr:glycosyltransferase family 2 protein [Candidatus Doudnabacteria bacterium]